MSLLPVHFSTIFPTHSVKKSLYRYQNHQKQTNVILYNRKIIIFKRFEIHVFVDFTRSANGMERPKSNAVIAPAEVLQIVVFLVKSLLHLVHGWHLYKRFPLPRHLQILSYEMDMPLYTSNKEIFDLL